MPLLPIQMDKTADASPGLFDRFRRWIFAVETGEIGAIRSAGGDTNDMRRRADRGYFSAAAIVPRAPKYLCRMPDHRGIAASRARMSLQSTLR